MRRPEWARRHQRPLSVQQPGNTVNLRRFNRFLQAHVREDRRETTGQERFPRPWRTYEEDIMGAGCSYFYGPFDVLLPFDVSKILVVDRLLLKQRLDIAPRLRNRLSPVKKANGLCQGRYPEDRHVLDDGGLSSVLGWHDHALQPSLAQRQCHRHGPSDSLHAAIEGQFPHHEVFRKLLRLDVPRRL